MPKRLLAYLSIITLAIAAPCTAQFIEKSVDSQTPFEGGQIDAYEGNTLYLKLAFYEKELPNSLSNKWAMTFWYSKDVDTSLGTQISGTWASSYICDFIGATNVLFRAGSYYWSVNGIHLNGNVKTWGRGTLLQKYNPGSDTNLQEQIAEINTDWFTNNVGAQVSTNQDDIALLQAGIGTNDTTLVFLQAQITTNAESIVFLQAQITSNDVDIAALAVRVTSNEVNIASNVLAAGTGLDITTNVVSLNSASQASDALADSAVQNNDTGLTLGGNFTSTGTLDGFEGQTLREGVAESYGVGYDGDNNTMRKTDLFAAVDQTGDIANSNKYIIASTAYVEGAIAARTSAGQADTFTATTTNYEWTAGNTWYCPSTSNINDAINAATAGDTIQLGSGTYTITEQIDVDKSLCIRGAGIGLTILASGTLSVTMLVTNSNVTLSDFTMASTYASGVAVLDIRLADGSGVFDDIIVHDLEVTHTGAAGGTGIRVWNCSVSFTDVRSDITETGGSGSAWAMQAINQGNANERTYITLNNCYLRATAASASESWGLSIEDSSASQDIQCDAYGSTFIQASTAGGAVRSVQSETDLNLFNCILNGDDVDVEEEISSIDLFQCTLVNNTFNGTPNFLGTQHGPTNAYSAAWDESQRVAIEADIYQHIESKVVQNDQENTLLEVIFGVDGTATNSLATRGFVQNAVANAASVDLFQTASQHAAFTDDLGLSLTTVAAWSSNYVLSAGVNLIETWWTTNQVQFLPAGPATWHGHASYSGTGNPVVELYWEWVYGVTTTNVATTSETQTISVAEGSYGVHAHNNTQIDFTNNYVGMTLYAIRTGGSAATLTLLGGGSTLSALQTPSLTVGSTESDPLSIHSDGSVTSTGNQNMGGFQTTNSPAYGYDWYPLAFFGATTGEGPDGNNAGSFAEYATYTATNNSENGLAWVSIEPTAQSIFISGSIPVPWNAKNVQGLALRIRSVSTTTTDNKIDNIIFDDIANASTNTTDLASTVAGDWRTVTGLTYPNSWSNAAPSWTENSTSIRKMNVRWEMYSKATNYITGEIGVLWSR